MDVTERASKVAQALRDHLKDLEAISQTGDRNTIFEKLKRWKERAARTISTSISPAEAHKFSEKQIRPMNMNPDANLKQNIQNQASFILGLVEEIEKYPKDFFGEDLPTPVAGALPGSYETAFRFLHPRILAVSKKRFSDANYADSVEAAFKEVNNRVKEHHRSVLGVEKDGTDLMFSAFESQHGSIVLDTVATDTGRNIQDGYKHLFAGSMMGIRNPKAHANIAIQPERALHFLFVASLLMQKLDEAKVT